MSNLTLAIIKPDAIKMEIPAKSMTELFPQDSKY